MSSTHRAGSVALRRVRVAAVIAAAGVMAVGVVEPVAAETPKPQTFWEITSSDLTAGGPFEGFTPDTATIVASGTSEVTMTATTATKGSWSATFAPPSGQPLVVGTYADVATAPTATNAGLSLTSHDQPCDTLTGTFSVWELTRDDSEDLTSFSATYDVVCDGTALRGSVAQDATITGPAPTGLRIHADGNEGLAGQPLLMTFTLSSPIPVEPFTPAITWQRTDGDGTVALRVTTTESGGFPDKLGTTPVTWQADFAGSSDHMAASSSLTIKPRKRTITLKVKHRTAKPTIGVHDFIGLSVTDEWGDGMAGKTFNYTMKNATGTHRGKATVTDKHTLHVGYTPKVGGAATWVFSYPGDKLRRSASLTVKNNVRFLKPKITVKMSKKTAAIGTSVTGTVTLGKTHGNRKLKVYACAMSKPLEKCTHLVAHQNLTTKKSFSFTYTLHKTTRFRVVFKGDTYYGARTVTRNVLAYPHSTVTMLGATSHAGGYAIYHGVHARARVHVSPPLPKEWAFVEVQAYAKGRWQSAGTSGFFQMDKHSNGTVKLTGTWPKNVRYRMRAHTEGDVDYLPAKGPWAYFRFT